MQRTQGTLETASPDFASLRRKPDQWVTPEAERVQDTVAGLLEEVWTRCAAGCGEKACGLSPAELMCATPCQGIESLIDVDGEYGPDGAMGYRDLLYIAKPGADAAGNLIYQGRYDRMMRAGGARGIACDWTAGPEGLVVSARGNADVPTADQLVDALAACQGREIVIVSRHIVLPSAS